MAYFSIGRRSWLRIALIAMFFMPGGSAFALSPEGYENALRIADQKIEREKSLRNVETANALSSDLVKELLGRYYEIGEWWEVSAIRFSPSMVRKHGASNAPRLEPREVALFRYEVMEILPGENPEVVLEIKQISRDGVNLADPRVTKMKLRMTNHLKQSEKSYLFQGRDQWTQASAEGIRSDLTVLELFPLDVPNARTAVRKRLEELPRLPEPLAQLKGVSQAYSSTQVDLSLWFEQDDFFGRPIQFLWERGNPWPTYLKVPQGVSVLVRKGMR